MTAKLNYADMGSFVSNGKLTVKNTLNRTVSVELLDGAALTSFLGDITVLADIGRDDVIDTELEFTEKSAVSLSGSNVASILNTSVNVNIAPGVSVTTYFKKLTIKSTVSAGAVKTYSGIGIAGAFGGIESNPQTKITLSGTITIGKVGESVVCLTANDLDVIANQGKVDIMTYAVLVSLNLSSKSAVTETTLTGNYKVYINNVSLKAYETMNLIAADRAADADYNAGETFKISSRIDFDYFKNSTGSKTLTDNITYGGEAALSIGGGVVLTAGKANLCVNNQDDYNDGGYDADTKIADLSHNVTPRATDGTVDKETAAKLSSWRISSEDSVKKSLNVADAVVFNIGIGMTGAKVLYVTENSHQTKYRTGSGNSLNAFNGEIHNAVINWSRLLAGYEIINDSDQSFALSALALDKDETIIPPTLVNVSGTITELTDSIEPELTIRTLRGTDITLKGALFNPYGNTSLLWEGSRGSVSGGIWQVDSVVTAPIWTRDLTIRNAENVGSGPFEDKQLNVWLISAEKSGADNDMNLSIDARNIYIQITPAAATQCYTTAETSAAAASLSSDPLLGSIRLNKMTAAADALILLKDPIRFAYNSNMDMTLFKVNLPGSLTYLNETKELYETVSIPDVDRYMTRYDPTLLTFEYLFPNYYKVLTDSNRKVIQITTPDGIVIKPDNYTVPPETISKIYNDPDGKYSLDMETGKLTILKNTDIPFSITKAEDSLYARVAQYVSENSWGGVTYQLSYKKLTYVTTLNCEDYFADGVNNKFRAYDLYNIEGIDNNYYLILSRGTLTSYTNQSGMYPSVSDPTIEWKLEYNIYGVVHKNTDSKTIEFWRADNSTDLFAAEKRLAKIPLLTSEGGTKAYSIEHPLKLYFGSDYTTSASGYAMKFDDGSYTTERSDSGDELINGDYYYKIGDVYVLTGKGNYCVGGVSRKLGDSMVKASNYDGDSYIAAAGDVLTLNADSNGAYTLPNGQKVGINDLTGKAKGINTIKYYTNENLYINVYTGELVLGTDSRGLTVSVSDIRDPKISYSVDVYSFNQSAKQGTIQREGLYHLAYVGGYMSALYYLADVENPNPEGSAAFTYKVLLKRVYDAAKGIDYFENEIKGVLCEETLSNGKTVWNLYTSIWDDVFLKGGELAGITIDNVYRINRYVSSMLYLDDWTLKYSDGSYNRINGVDPMYNYWLLVNSDEAYSGIDYPDTKNSQEYSFPQNGGNTGCRSNVGMTNTKLMVSLYLNFNGKAYTFTNNGKENTFKLTAGDKVFLNRGADGMITIPDVNQKVSVNDGTLQYWTDNMYYDSVNNLVGVDGVIRLKTNNIYEKDAVVLPSGQQVHLEYLTENVSKVVSNTPLGVVFDTYSNYETVSSGTYYVDDLYGRVYKKFYAKFNENYMNESELFYSYGFSVLDPNYETQVEQEVTKLEWLRILSDDYKKITTYYSLNNNVSVDNNVNIEGGVGVSLGSIWWAPPENSSLKYRKGADGSEWTYNEGSDTFAMTKEPVNGKYKDDIQFKKASAAPKCYVGQIAANNVWLNGEDSYFSQKLLDAEPDSYEPNISANSLFSNLWYYDLRVDRRILRAPEKVIWTGDLGTTASWDAVKNAVSYSLRVYKDGAALSDAFTVSGTSYDLKDIIMANGSGTYTFKVKALSAANSGIKDSEESNSGSSYIYYKLALKDALLDGIVNKDYSETIVNAPCKAELYSGDLPAGLIFDSSMGRITGTPLKPGTYSFIIKASSSLETVYKAYTIKVTVEKEVVSLTVKKSPANATLSPTQTPCLLYDISDGARTIDLSAMILTAAYNDGSTEDIAYDDSRLICSIPQGTKVTTALQRQVLMVTMEGITIGVCYIGVSYIDSLYFCVDHQGVTHRSDYPEMTEFDFAAGDTLDLSVIKLDYYNYYGNTWNTTWSAGNVRPATNAAVYLNGVLTGNRTITAADNNSILTFVVRGLTKSVKIVVKNADTGTDLLSKAAANLNTSLGQSNYSVDMTKANTKETVQAWLKPRIDALAAGITMPEGTVVTLTLLDTFSAAIAGTAQNINGTTGYAPFMVTLESGGSREVLYSVCVIIPTGYQNSYTITFVEDNTDYKKSTSVSKGEKVQLPTSYGFTVPEGKELSGWALGSMNGTLYNIGDYYTPAADASFYAVWEEQKKEIASLNVGGTVNLTLTEGDKLDLSGVTVAAVYKDGSQADISSSGLNFSIPSGSAVSASDHGKPVLVTYDGISAVIGILNINKKPDSAIPKELKVEGLENLNLNLLDGDTLNLDDIGFILVYEDNSETRLTSDEVMMSVRNGRKLALSDNGKALTASYAGLTAALGSLTVKAVEAENITINGTPRLSYKAGEKFEPGNFTVSVTYNNGTKSVIDAGQLSTSPANGTALDASYNKKAITASIGGKDFTIGTLSIASPKELKVTGLDPSRLELFEGDMLNLGTIGYTLVYDDNTEETLSPDKVTTSARNGEKLSLSDNGKALTASYAGLTVTLGIFYVNVKAVEAGSVTRNEAINDTISVTSGNAPTSANQIHRIRSKYRVVFDREDIAKEYKIKLETTVDGLSLNYVAMPESEDEAGNSVYELRKLVLLKQLIFSLSNAGITRVIFTLDQVSVIADIRELSKNDFRIILDKLTEIPDEVVERAAGYDRISDFYTLAFEEGDDGVSAFTAGRTLKIRFKADDNTDQTGRYKLLLITRPGMEDEKTRLIDTELVTETDPDTGARTLNFEGEMPDGGFFCVIREK